MSRRLNARLPQTSANSPETKQIRVFSALARTLLSESTVRAVTYPGAWETETR